MTLSGRTCIVTGGTGALGSAVVAQLAAAGATVHTTWRSEAERDRFSVRGDVHLHRVNLLEEAEVDALYDRVGALWGSVHIVGGFSMAPVVDTSVDRLEFLWRLNTLTAFLCCRAAVRNLSAAGEGGRIVQVAARPVLQPSGGTVAYAMSKAGVATLTQCLAEEVREQGIFVNSVVPSIMDTPANRAAMPDADHARWPTVEEVARAMVHLVSPDNAVVTGALVPVYGRT